MYQQKQLDEKEMKRVDYCISCLHDNRYNPNMDHLVMENIREDLLGEIYKILQKSPNSPINARGQTALMRFIQTMDEKGILMMA